VKTVTEQNLHAEHLLTSHEVGDLLQVNPSSVKKWVNEGRIAAFRTPGGHRRIRVADLVDFLNRHAMPIPRLLAAVSKKRLLIVDDDLMHLRALERRMRPYRPRVQIELTSNGIDALVMVGSFKPDLIVLDVYMPELDGIEVCRRLKRKPETRIGVIVTSAHLTKAVEDKALEAGALTCVPKPMDLKVLLEHLGLLQQPLGGGASRKGTFVEGQ
jgi:excisionase family DNA binding protein